MSVNHIWALCLILHNCLLWHKMQLSACSWSCWSLVITWLNFCRSNLNQQTCNQQALFDSQNCGRLCFWIWSFCLAKRWLCNRLSHVCERSHIFFFWFVCIQKAWMWELSMQWLERELLTLHSIFLREADWFLVARLLGVVCDPQCADVGPVHGQCSNISWHLLINVQCWNKMDVRIVTGMTYPLHSIFSTALLGSFGCQITSCCQGSLLIQFPIHGVQSQNYFCNSVDQRPVANRILVDITISFGNQEMIY